jgi:hypothetical protein
MRKALIECRGDRGSCRRDGNERCARISLLRQSAGVCGARSPPIAGPHDRPDSRHRARLSVGERLLRELQLEAARRVPKRRDFLLDRGGPCAGPTMTRPLQHNKSALLAGLQVTGTADLDIFISRRKGHMKKPDTSVSPMRKSLRAVTLTVLRLATPFRSSLLPLQSLAAEQR